MAATMLAGNPQAISLPNPTAPWGDHSDPNGIITHLSPQYDNSTDELDEIMNGSSPSQLSPQTFETNEGCNNNWMISHGTPYGLVYSNNSSHYMNNGGQSPDSGIYSPHGSPQALDLSDTRLQTSCAGLALSTGNCGDLSQAGGMTADYPPTTAATYSNHPVELFAPVSSQSLTPYTQSPSIPPHFESLMFTNSEAASRTGYPQPYGTSSEEQHGNMDPIPIIPLDQTTGNPIRFYSDCTTADLSPRPPYDPITPPCATSSFSTGLTFSNVKSVTENPPVKEVKRTRRPKPQVQVDPSDIKDVPASAQLWEFLLKVLKKPKYNYMVSWESRKDGLFRFHDPSAFAALWGRHRNRPNMTYDKVARALRYYYRREILEQVGGRLTYKFTPRLCKQFADKQHHHSSAAVTSTATTSNNVSSHSSLP